MTRVTETLDGLGLELQETRRELEDYKFLARYHQQRLHEYMRKEAAARQEKNFSLKRTLDYIQDDYIQESHLLLQELVFECAKIRNQLSTNGQIVLKDSEHHIERKDI
jgi:hypothetical protein